MHTRARPSLGVFSSAFSCIKIGWPSFFRSSEVSAKSREVKIEDKLLTGGPSHLLH